MAHGTEGRRLRQSLLRLLEAAPSEDDQLLATLEEHAPPGEPLYSSIVFVLTHLRFGEREARRHWERVAEHRRELGAALGRDVGLRVALLDYFVNVSQELKSPKVIEISIFEKTERRALTDALTGLYNRAYFAQALRRELHRARRQGLHVSLVLLDLDDFKRINDTRGHLAGDRVLVKTAGVVAGSLREVDLCARYGGEEFAVILPDADRHGAWVVAERIRARVAEHFATGRGPKITLSGGIATFPEDGLDATQLVREADRLLYRAKADGKNRVQAGEANRRRHERRPLVHPVEVAVGAGRTLRAVTQDVSEGGLLMCAAEPVPVGSRVGLTVRRDAAAPLSLQAQVVRSEPGNGAGGWAVGVRLLTEPRRNRALLTLSRRAAAPPARGGTAAQAR